MSGRQLRNLKLVIVFNAVVGFIQLPHYGRIKAKFFIPGYVQVIFRPYISARPRKRATTLPDVEKMIIPCNNF